MDSHFMYGSNGGPKVFGGMSGIINMNENISVEYENLSRLKNSIIKAYKSGKYCDLTIKSKDGVAIRAHKLVLASQSKYLASKLDSADTDCDEISISELKSEALRVVVDYIYTQKIKSGAVTKENAKEVLAAGELFKFEDIKEEAAIIMAKNLDEENAIDVMTNNIFAGAVSNNAFTYTANNFQLFLNKEHLKKRMITEIKPGELCHILSQKNLMLWDKNGLYLDAVDREKQLFFFVMSYVAHSVEDRLPELKKILTCLKLPLLIHGKILSLALMGEGLKKAPEELSGLLADIIEPYENLTGAENLVVIFTGERRKNMRPSQRRMMSDTCKMRYATIPHSTTCSEVARTEQPWGERNTFCPEGSLSLQKSHRTTNVIKSITVCIANMSVAEGEKTDDSDQLDRRVAGLILKFDDGSEEKVGETEHNTTRQETYTLEEGELVLEVHSHYPTSLLVKKNNKYQSELFNMTEMYDLSFVTNKERKLGPMKESALSFGDGLTMRIPSKIRHLEKNCPGSFSWLQGFGSENVNIPEKGERISFFPIWGFKAHFKVYPLKSQDFDFVSGFKKHYQFSLDGLSDNPCIESLEDLDQIERSPVHEVVDLEDSESDAESEPRNKRKPGRPVGQNEDSIMVVDSDEDNDDDEGDEEEEEDEDEGFQHGMIPQGFHPRFRGKFNKTDGGEDEPIEIESSSEEEGETEKDTEKNGDDDDDDHNDQTKRKREGSLEDTSSEGSAKKSKED